MGRRLGPFLKHSACLATRKALRPPFPCRRGRGQVRSGFAFTTTISTMFPEISDHDFLARLAKDAPMPRRMARMTDAMR